VLFVQLLFVHSRFLLGLGGVFVVIMSVAMSVGICGFLHVKATLIITEVIPFLVLAIGVDNVFIIGLPSVRAFTSSPPYEH